MVQSPFRRTYSTVFGRNCPLLVAISTLILPLRLQAQSESRPEIIQTENAQASGVLLPIAPEPGLRYRGRPGGDRGWRTPSRTFGFSELAQAAGTIFSGTVTAITPHPVTSGQGIDTVSVTFHVERAIRGAIPNQDLTISQWMGLWLTGQRYLIGERVLVFLYPTSKLGLTSSVAGAMGRFAIDAHGWISFSTQHRSAFQGDPFLAQKSRVSFSEFAAAVRRSEITE